MQGQVKMDAQWASRFGRRGQSHSSLGPASSSSLSPSKGSSPILTPRRYAASIGHGHIGMDDCSAHDSLRRYEAAEGSASTSPPLAETPPYLRWAENLHHLLADPDGVGLFEKYLEQENCSHLLKVIFSNFILLPSNLSFDLCSSYLYLLARLVSSCLVSVLVRV